MLLLLFVHSSVCPKFVTRRAGAHRDDRDPPHSAARRRRCTTARRRSGCADARATTTRDDARTNARTGRASTDRDPNDAQGVPTDIASALHAHASEALSPDDADGAAGDFAETQRLRDAATTSANEGSEDVEAFAEYYRALRALESRIPISEGAGHARVEFEWFDVGRGVKAAPGTIASRDAEYEKCAVLYNYAAALSRRGAREANAGRSDEGIKRACAAFQQSAGAFEMLADVSERKLGQFAASADVGRDFCETMIKLHLGQAQECFYEKAKAKKSSHAIVSKLAQQARVYYEDALEGAGKLVGYLDEDLTQYLNFKRAYVGAEAFRLAGKIVLDADETNVGPAVARLRQARDLLAQTIRDARVVSSDAELERTTKFLDEVIAPELKAVERDNECVYMERVPKFEDLPALAAANMVKPIQPPAEHLSPVDVKLFQSIVPDSGAKALSRYTEMVDELIRNETDTLAMASDEARVALREMELPETLIALSTPVPLGGDLEERVGAFRSSGGAGALSASLSRVDELNRQCSNIVQTIRETLDTEAAEDAASRAVHGEGAWRREASSSKNREMMQVLKRYEVDLEVATKSDTQLKERLEGAGGVLEVLSEENIKNNAPTLTQPLALLEDDASVASEMQATLEDLEAIGNERAGIEELMRKTKSEDNILTKLMAQSGESLDALFKEEMKKYDQSKDGVMLNISKQADALSRLRTLHEKFVTIYDIEALRRDVESHEHSVRHALSIVGDLRSGMEQGVRFYSGFLDAARRTLTDVQEYASARRLEKEAIAEELRVQKARADERAAQMATQMNQMHFHQPPPPPQQYYHPSAPAYPSPAYGAQPPPPHWQNQPGRYANWENQS